MFSFEFLALQSGLAAIVAAEIDLVVLLTVDDVLRVQVIEHGRPRALRTNTSETAVHRVRERARGRLYRRS